MTTAEILLIVINGLGVIATFSAVVASLFLATKSRTIRFRLYRKRIDLKELKDKDFHKIMLLNTGHVKFTITRIGYYIDRKYYCCMLNNFLKKLDIPITDDHNTRHNSEIDMDISTYLKEGESIEFYLYPKCFNFIDSKRNRKVFYFIMINDKIKRIYTGFRENEFYKIIAPLHYKAHLQKGDQDPKTKDDLFFRV